MPKLNQIIAIEKGVKSSTYAKVSDAYKHFQKPALFGGITCSYSPKNDDGDALPPESTLVRMRVEKMQDAVKFAREEANNSQVEMQHVGDAFFGFLFAK